MNRSSIKPKISKCCDCPITEPAKMLIAGRCDYHYKKHRAAINEDKKKARSLATPSRVFVRDAPETKPQDSYAAWYAEQRQKMTGKCCNCGKASSKFSDNYFTWSIAHVLPKSLFPSVGKHPENFIEMCGLCHTEYDRGWYTAVKMKVFGLARIKFQIIEPLIAPEERRRIPECFLNPPDHHEPE